MDALDMETAQRIDFKSKSENIIVVERLINDLCDKHAIHEDQYGNLLIALTEAVNNAIMHGNSSDPNKNVTVEYSTVTFLFGSLLLPCMMALFTASVRAINKFPYWSS